MVTTAGAMGIFFKRGDTLYFPELLAAGDRQAKALLQACRNATGVFQSELCLPARGTLLLGEGAREPALYLTHIGAADQPSTADLYPGIFAFGDAGNQPSKQESNT